MRTYLGLACLVACTANPDGDYPNRPGGIGGVGNTVPGIDAATTPGGSNTMGRVCLISDLRLWPSGCAATGFAGLSVKVGDTVGATTEADGSFMLSVAPTKGSVLSVSGDGIATSAVVVGDVTSLMIPAPRASYFVDFLDGNGLTVPNGLGSIAVAVTSSPKAGFTGEVNPPATYSTFYDANSPTLWQTTQTGDLGRMFFAGVTAGTTNVSGLTTDYEFNLTTTVLADTITFVSAGAGPR